MNPILRVYASKSTPTSPVMLRFRQYMFDSASRFVHQVTIRLNMAVYSKKQTLYLSRIFHLNFPHSCL